MPSARIIEEQVANQALSNTPTLKIRNKRTGEVREIQASEAQTYGLSPMAALDRLEAQQTILGLESGEGPKGTPEQQMKRSMALESISVMEELYGRGESENVGTEKDLSLSPGATRWEKAKGKSGAFQKSISDSEFQEDLNIYKGQINLALSALTQALGSGTPQEQESLRILGESVPNELSTDAEAEAWFKNVRTILGDTERKKAIEAGATEEELRGTDLAALEGIATLSDVTPGAGGEPPTDITQQAVDEATGLTPLQTKAKKVADAAPTVMGLGGALIGGVALGGAGSVLPGAGTLAGYTIGSGIGTAIGTASGIAVQNLIEDVAGIQDESAGEQLKRAGTQTAIATAVDVAFGTAFAVVAKGGGLVLTALGKGLDDIPLKSIRVNPSDLRKFAAKTKEDLAQFLLNRNILGENAMEIAGQKAAQLQGAFDNLALNEKIVIPISDLKDRFSKELLKLAGVGEEGAGLVPSAHKGIAKKVLAEWESLLKQFEDKGITELTPEMLTELRRLTDELVPESAWVDPNVKNVAIRLRTIYNDVVQEAVDRTLIESGEEAGETGLKKLGQELSKYYEFLRIAEKQSHLGRGSVLPGITRGTSATAGAVVGAPFGVPGSIVGAGLGLGAEQMLRDPAVLKIIYQLAQQGKRLTPAMQAALKAAGITLPPIAGVGAGQLSQPN